MITYVEAVEVVCYTEMAVTITMFTSTVWLRSPWTADFLAYLLDIPGWVPKSGYTFLIIA